MESLSEKVEIQLLYWPQDPTMRSHVGIYIPPNRFIVTAGKGMMFHVKGSPSLGYLVECKDFLPEDSDSSAGMEFVPLASVDIDTKFIEAMEKVAESVPAPGAWTNPLGIPDGVNGRNCESWLIDVVQRLVQQQLLPPTALTVVADNRRGPGLTRSQAQVQTAARRTLTKAQRDLEANNTSQNRQALESAELRYQQTYQLAKEQAQQNAINAVQVQKQQTAIQQAQQAAQQSSIQKSAGGAGNVANMISMFQQGGRGEASRGGAVRGHGRG